MTSHANAPSEPYHELEGPPSALLGALLNLVLPGVGYLYIGQPQKALFLGIPAWILCGLCGLLNVVYALDAALVVREARRSGQPIEPWQKSWILFLLDMLLEAF